MKYGKYRTMMMDYLRFKNEPIAYANVGDTIQGLAMDYIFETIGISDKDVCWFRRDDDFKNVRPEPIRIPFYTGLVDDSEKRLPLPSNVTPYFTSLVLSYSDYLNKYPKIREYLRAHAPIGCRDEHTKNIFVEYNIPAYLMGCFTVCLPKRKTVPRNGKVFLVDTPPPLEEYIPEDIKARAVKLAQSVPFEVYPVTVEEDTRQKEIARNYLKRYRDEADLIVTSRLHAALPCMAMGIPVILIRQNYDFRFDWSSKFFKLYQLDEAKDIDWNPEVPDIEPIKKLIISYVKLSMADDPAREQVLKELDAYYSDRPKLVMNKNIRRAVENAKKQFNGRPINYAIWGAGAYGHFCYEVVRELYKEANLAVVFNKYVRRDIIFNVPICSGDNIGQYDLDYVFIATNPGKNESLSALKNKYGETYSEHCAVVSTLMKS